MATYEVKAPNGKIYNVNGPAGASKQDVINAVLGHLEDSEPEATPQAAPAAPPSTGRTWGEAIKDVALSLPSGGGQLLQLPGQVARIAGANVTPDSILGSLEERGKQAQDIAQEMRSSGYKTQAAEAQKRIAEFGPEGGIMGAIKKAPVAAYEFIKSPTLMSVFLTEQIPQLALTGGAGKGAQALRMIFGDAAKLGVQDATKAALATGVKTEIATGALLQGMDVGSDTYKEVYDYLIQQKKPEPEARAIALEKGRIAAAGAAIASLAAQNLPGARKAQEALLGGKEVGVTALRGAVGTGFGESYSEGIEEGAGAAIKGQLAAQVNPQRDPYAGVGEATGMGVAAGFGIGAPLGAVSGGANAAQLAKQTEDQKNKITPTGNPVSSSPIVSTMTIDREGIKSVKTQHEDGTVDIDGVQVVPSGMEEAAANIAGEEVGENKAPEAAAFAPKEGFVPPKVVEGERAKGMSHLTAEQQSKEDTDEIVRVAIELLQENPELKAYEISKKLAEETGNKYSPQYLRSIVREAERLAPTSKTKKNIITDEGETEADLKAQLEEEESKLGQGAAAAASAPPKSELDVARDRRVVEPYTSIKPSPGTEYAKYSFKDENGVHYNVSYDGDVHVKLPANLMGKFNNQDTIIFRNGDARSNVYPADKLPLFVPPTIKDAIYSHVNGKGLNGEGVKNIKKAVDATYAKRKGTQQGALEVADVKLNIKAAEDAKLKAEQEKARAATTGTVGTGTSAKGAGASIQTGTPAGATTDVAGGVGVGGAGTTVSKSNVGTEDKQSSLNESKGKAFEGAFQLRALAKSVKQLTTAKDESEYQKALDSVIDTVEEIFSSGVSTEKTKSEANKVLDAEFPRRNTANPEQDIVDSRERLKKMAGKTRSEVTVRRLNAKLSTLESKLQSKSEEINQLDPVDKKEAAEWNNLKKDIDDLTQKKKDLLLELRMVKKDMAPNANTPQAEAAAARSKARGAGPTLSFEQVESLVKSIIARWVGAPVTHIVRDMSELPPHLQKFLIDNNAEDSPGLYDTKKKDVYIIANKLSSDKDVVLTLIHETVGHYGLRRILKDKYPGTMKAAYFNPLIKSLADAKMSEDPKLTKELAVEESFATLSESDILNTPSLKQLIDKLISLVRDGIRRISGERMMQRFSDAEVRNIINSSYRSIRSEEATTSSAVTAEEAPAALSPARASVTKKATEVGKPNATTSIEEDVEWQAEQREKKLNRPTIKDFYLSADGWHWLINKFENNRVYAKVKENAMDLANTVVRTGAKFNAIYTSLISSGGKALYIKSEYLQKHEDKINNLAGDYSKVHGMTFMQALDRLGLYMIGRHEPERRHEKYLENVAINNVVAITDSRIDNGAKLSPAEMREKIIKMLYDTETAIPEKEIEGYRDLLEYLVDTFKAKTDVDAKSKDFYSPRNYKAINENEADYNVVGGYPSDLTKKWADASYNDKAQSIVDEFVKTVGEMNDAVIKVSKLSNHWNNQVNNIKNFYNYKFYVPFKGRPDESPNSSQYELSGTRLSGDFRDIEMPSAGRESEAENPILQIMVDSAKAAWHAGSANTPLAIKNLIESGEIEGSKITTIPFSDRFIKDLNIDPYRRENMFFYRASNGDIEVYKIEDRNLRESIRQSFKPPQPIMQFVNSITSSIGQMHTRFNIGFAPMNYNRDAITNVFNTALSKFGPKVAAEYALSAATKLFDGGLIKAGKVQKLFSEGRLDDIRKLAGSGKNADAFYMDALEFYEEGGPVSYRETFNVQSKLKQLTKKVGNNYVAKSGNAIMMWFDVYNGAFENASRVAMYSTIKADLIRKNTTEGMSKEEIAAVAAAARVEASAFAKETANFETVGEWGRAAGGLYMYFRAAATGASRAIDALAPAWSSVDTVVNRIPSAESLAKKYYVSLLEQNMTPKEASAAALAEGQKERAKQEKNIRENFAVLKTRAKLSMYLLSAAGAMMYAMAMSASDDDEMGRNKVAIDDMSRWTRYLRLPLGIFSSDPSLKDKFLQLPWGFGPSAFMALGAQTAALGAGNMKTADYFGNSLQILVDSFMPIPVSRISPVDSPANFFIDSAIPSIARPFTEYISNMNALGAPIYSNRQYKYGGAYTGGDSIPEIYKDAAKSIFNMTDGDQNISPNVLYFFASNYADGVVNIASTARNLYLASQGKKDFDIKSDSILLNNYVGKASNYDARQYDAIRKQIEEKKGKLDMLKNSPEEYATYVSNHPLDQMIVDIYNQQANGMLKDLQTQANQIRSYSFFTPKDKKDLLEPIMSLENFTKRGIIDMFDAFDIKP
jgi:hypothetical protein